MKGNIFIAGIVAVAIVALLLLFSGFRMPGEVIGSVYATYPPVAVIEYQNEHVVTEVGGQCQQLSRSWVLVNAIPDDVYNQQDLINLQASKVYQTEPGKADDPRAFSSSNFLKLGSFERGYPDGQVITARNAVAFAWNDVRIDQASCSARFDIYFNQPVVTRLPSSPMCTPEWNLVSSGDCIGESRKNTYDDGCGRQEFRQDSCEIVAERRGSLLEPVVDALNNIYMIIMDGVNAIRDVIT